MRKVLRRLRRLLIVAAILYFAIAAYGRYQQHRAEAQAWADAPCPCTECDCGPPLEDPQP